MKCPFFKMFTAPRPTTRKVLDGSRNKWFWLFSLLQGFAVNAQVAQWNSMTYEYNFFAVFAGCLVLAIPVGALGFSIMSFFLWITGRLLKGNASFSDMQVAVSWAHAPYLINSIAWVILLFSFGSIAFQASFPKMAFDGIGFWIVMLTSIAATIGGIWAIVLMCLSIAEAQGFSSWKGVLNYVLGLVALWVVLFIIKTIIMYADKMA